jgi:GTP cyclohydrolase I
MHTKNPVEFMTSIRDALDEKATRESLMMETDKRFAKRWPQYVEGNREYLQKLRKFWNDAAYEAENMTKEELMAIIDQYKKSLRN